MSPQPAAQQTEKETDEQREKRLEAEAMAEWVELVKDATEGDSSGAKQVQRAINLEAQIEKLRKQIDSNRKYLRLMSDNDELNEAQAEFTEVFYADRAKGERKDEADVAATRRAREHARKNGSTES